MDDTKNKNSDSAKVSKVCGQIRTQVFHSHSHRDCCIVCDSIWDMFFFFLFVCFVFCCSFGVKLELVSQLQPGISNSKVMVLSPLSSVHHLYLFLGY